MRLAGTGESWRDTIAPDVRLAQIVDMVTNLDDPERAALLDKLSDVMCMHCGTDVRTSGRCYCWNDD